MIVVALTTSIPAKMGGFVWYPFRVEDAETIEGIWKKLSDDGVVLGDKLETKMRNNGIRYATGKTPMIIGTAAVVTITPMHIEIELGDAYKGHTSA